MYMNECTRRQFINACFLFLTSSLFCSLSVLHSLDQTHPFIATLVRDGVLGEGDPQDDLGVKSAQETPNPLWPLLQRTQSIRTLLGSNCDMSRI